jgi:hypothetical protein
VLRRWECGNWRYCLQAASHFWKGGNGVAGSSRWARLEPSEPVGLEVDSGIQVSVSILSGMNSH